MKLGQNMCSNDSSADFENGYGSLKKHGSHGAGNFSFYGYYNHSGTLLTHLSHILVQ